MKSVAIVTHVRFWLEGAGLYARSLEIIRYLSSRTKLSILFIGKENIGDLARIRRLKLSFEFIWVDKVGGSSHEKISSNLSKILGSHCFDVCIFVRYEAALYISALPKSIKSIWDVDDLYSEAADKKIATIAMADALEKQQGRDYLKSKELELFHEFDCIAVIQSEHKSYVESVCPGGLVIVVPHSVVSVPCTIRREAKKVCFIASAWEANIDGFEWFVQNVWPLIIDLDIELSVYGGICQFINKNLNSRIKIKGYVSQISQCYSEADVIINPVRYGTGLKIKTVEALAYGVPIVTTSEGSRGLRNLNNYALIEADSASDFSGAIKSLCRSYELRANIGKNAYLYAKENFSPQACYAPLLTIIDANH